MSGSSRTENKPRVAALLWVSAFQESTLVMARYLVLVAAGVTILWTAVSLHTLWRRSHQAPQELKRQYDSETQSSRL